MNKLLTAIASFSLLAMTFASAEIKAGVSIGFTTFDVDGQETLKSSANVTKSSNSDDVFVPAIFLEAGSSDAGLYIGMDYTNTAAVGSKSSAKVDTDTDDASDTAGTNKASADVESVTSIYVIKTLGGSGFYLKAGLASADLITTESLDTGSTYGNTSVDGTLFGAGFERQNDSGVFLRASYEMRDYDEFTLQSSADADSVTNSVKADVDSSELKISIGKAF
jgi:hypothetical protein